MTVVDHMREQGQGSFKVRCRATERNHLAVDFIDRVCSGARDGIAVIDPDKATVPAHVTVTAGRSGEAA